jgi:hypothetical protein
MAERVKRVSLQSEDILFVIPIYHSAPPRIKKQAGVQIDTSNL